MLSCPTCELSRGPQLPTLGKRRLAQSDFWSELGSPSLPFRTSSGEVCSANLSSSRNCKGLTALSMAHHSLFPSQSHVPTTAPRHTQDLFVQRDCKGFTGNSTFLPGSLAQGVRGSACGHKSMTHYCASTENLALSPWIRGSPHRELGQRGQDDRIWPLEGDGWGMESTTEGLSPSDSPHAPTSIPGGSPPEHICLAPSKIFAAGPMTAAYASLKWISLSYGISSKNKNPLSLGVHAHLLRLL